MSLLRAQHAFTCLLLLVAFMVVSGAAPAAELQPLVNAGEFSRPIKVACVGDSITQGVGTRAPATESYPAQLQTLLGEKWEVKNFGVGGRTLLRKADAYATGPALQYNPDVVVILLGTNDSRQKTWDAHGAEFVGDYRAIIESFRALASHPKILVCLPVPMFPGRWELSEEILTTKTIPAIQTVAQETGVRLLDLHTPLIDCAKDFPDTVHPNATAAGILAKLVAGALNGAATTTGPAQ